ncbi:oxygen-independent coproporphyrinogen III oxidase [Listeria seeligeri]|uniref:radical SAM family heme chaperone HemW n=1 Tax=Listeria seeligeri TaxID=1640 RepID=UPI0001C4EA43|nr:radical SAM family heme chaperone HemW [Listeria seeligeri]MBC1723851.1 oxygen-independent coproporphyrinogen III oxidase [Listeria seeligeri]MBF2345658.1 oxygen-independent coproporphyrinogen III oxidase [Listeria seeligeri]MBF2437581.1 oxygen-independent coproporphyrinogen III oxidase [Listeria seeligeri]MBF2479906.1 oxygen-independent coproporphyrinogen III oxidase [Listeria seeligeri]CBH27544.1 oxygen-independent coproporphyrinogen III oxidase [Listeria seeligeri serovar 1/2b str. SLCC3
MINEESSHNTSAVYIHIPFCEHICYYCDFNKVFLEGQPVDEYVDLLIKEMQITAANKQMEPIDTVFVGGGTPTTLNEAQIAKLCTAIQEIFPMKEEVEFSFEANPGDLSVAKVQTMKDYGVNRISMGVQSFNNDLLKKIGRIHTVKDVYQSVENMRTVGFENVSIDLIFSLPGQTEADFQDTLNQALALDLPHYSAYSLIIEPKTIFYNLMQKGKLFLPGQDAEANMYDLLLVEMEKHGRKQYEISNFAKEGFESKHNITYWSNEHYYGFGAGAHGYIGNTRYSNFGPIKKYMEPLQENKLPVFQQKELTLKEKMEEEMFLGLRKVSGVSKARFQRKFGQDLDATFQNAIQKTMAKGWLENNEENVALTRNGRFLGNNVFQEFL